MADAGGGATAAEQKLRAAHQALLRARDLQFDFAAAQPVKEPPWLRPLIEFLKAAAPVLELVFWAGVAAGVLLVLWFVVRELLATRFAPRRQVPNLVDWRPDPEAARALLEDADRLAGEGRYDEAIHLLLFRSIDEIGGRRPGAVRPALTSRDIAALIAMPPSARAAFERISEAVERSFFGGRAAGADTFAACRGDYEAFAFAEGWA